MSPSEITTANQSAVASLRRTFHSKAAAPRLIRVTRLDGRVRVRFRAYALSYVADPRA